MFIKTIIDKIFGSINTSVEKETDAILEVNVPTTFSSSVLTKQNLTVNGSLTVLSGITGSFNYESVLDDFLYTTETQHPSGTYAKCEMVPGKIFLSNITWYSAPDKSIKLISKDFSYNSNIPVPVTISMKLYDGTSNNLIKKTIVDTIVYDKIFEISRTRTII